MRRSQFPWAIVIIEGAAFGAFHITGLILASLGLGVVYLASLRVHPRIRHTGFRGCGGTGEHRGAVFTWTHRKCPRCNGGRLVRWGAGHLGAGHVQAEYQQAKQARKVARQNHTWR